MNTKLVKGLFAGVIAGALVASLSAQAFAAPDGGNGRRGKFVWKKYCRTCHDGSSGPEISPVSKTQAQWEAIMEDVASIPCKDKWDGGMDIDRDVKDIYNYLYFHAMDSDQPETCG